MYSHKKCPDTLADEEDCWGIFNILGEVKQSGRHRDRERS